MRTICDCVFKKISTERVNLLCPETTLFINKTFTPIAFDTTCWSRGGYRSPASITRRGRAAAGAAAGRAAYQRPTAARLPSFIPYLWHRLFKVP